jgi:hypothetical protein
MSVVACAIERAQVVADLLCARAAIRTAVADQRELRAADHAVVRRPELAVGGIHVARIRGRVEPAVPAAVGQRPVRGTTGVVTGTAARQAPEQRPANVPALVADDEILDRPAERGGQGERLVDRGCAFEIEPAQIGRLRVLRRPVERDAVSPHSPRAATDPTASIRRRAACSCRSSRQ